MDRRRAGKTLLKSGQEWPLSVQLGQLKTGQGGKGIVNTLATFKGYGVEKNRSFS